MNLEGMSHSLVFGGGHGIGLSLVRKLLDKSDYVWVTYRKEGRAEGLFDLKEEFQGRLTLHQLDPLNVKELEHYFSQLKEKLQNVNFDLVINCIGVLETKFGGPEKSLRDINLNQLNEVFQVNAFVTPLLAGRLKPFFSKSKPSVFAALSAMVGSNEENKIGGWYSYRASKAALNMFLKNISIEFKRQGIRTSVLSIHPGTTETDLSKAYLKGVKHKVWPQDKTADNILCLIEGLSEEDTGLFLNWDGRIISW